MSARPSVEIQEALACVEELRQINHVDSGPFGGLQSTEHKLDRLRDILLHLHRVFTDEKYIQDRCP